MVNRTAQTGGRKDLGQFLRAMRERADPAWYGIVTGRRRRAPGLLREEVALSAGISATWYTWLEQGREANPSAQVLNALADVLKMIPVEREHLFRLARPEWVSEGTSMDRRLSTDPRITELVAALAPNPAYALDRAWNFVAWNDEAAKLLGGFDREDPVKRNLLTRLFLDPAWRGLFVDWDLVARSAVAQFRTATVGFAEANDVRSVLEQLKVLSREFNRLWAELRVEDAPIWSKRINWHGKVTTYDYFMLAPAGIGRETTISLYRRQVRPTRRA
jgi:transcriptional regulator with XRE-family HTH domain